MPRRVRESAVFGVGLDIRFADDHARLVGRPTADRLGEHLRTARKCLGPPRRGIGELAWGQTNEGVGTADRFHGLLATRRRSGRLDDAKSLARRRSGHFMFLT